MVNIEGVKAALAQATEQGNSALNQIRSAAEQTDQVLTRLRGVAAGTNHAKVLEAIPRAEQTKQRLHETATLIQGSANAAREYVGILG
jgi:hypothetical protein